MKCRRLAVAAAAAAALALPPAAQAAPSASVSAGELTITGGSEDNDLGIEQRPGGYELQDNSGRISAGPGCVASKDQYGNPDAVCSGVTTIAASLGAGDDTLRPIGPRAAPLSYSGGAGTDAIVYLEQQAGLGASNDGVANDGPSGTDNVAADVERVFGTQFADTLALGPAGGELFAGDGDDKLTGGPGDDVIDAAYVEDVGVDAGSFYAEGKDTVTCGGGADLVLADHQDSVAADCEVVAVDDFGGDSDAFRVTGSPHGDKIGPLPYGWGPATVRALGGNDTIRTDYEVHRVYGGSGNDRIIGFDQAAQAFYGESGNDRIDVRDKKATKYDRDTVSCGSGKDLVYANKNDKVSRDCERVKRRQ
jgi:hypothetical protein